MTSLPNPLQSDSPAQPAGTAQPASFAVETETLRIQPRRLVQSLTGYGAPDEGRYSMVRLDFNENTEGLAHVLPEGIPPVVANAYPEYGTCLAKLAGFYGLKLEQILLTNGSDEALAVITQTFIEPEVDTAVISSPTFAMIPHYLKLAGAKLKEVPVLPDLTFDWAGLEAALAQGCKLLMLASPDNPTGAVMSAERLSGWCNQYPDTLFVLDEAYVEYAGESALPLLARHNNLLITRTFSKAWGLAGVRLGVALGHPQLIEWLTRVRSPYSVNALAVWTVEQALGKSEQVFAQAKSAMARKNQLIKELKGLGFGITEGHAHFFLLHAGVEAAELAAYAHTQGVLIRNRSPQKWPTSHPLWGTLRVNVGTEAENQKLLAVLRQYKAETGLLFDLDDTLVDTSESFDATVEQLIRQFSEMPLAPGELSALRAEGGFNDDWDATVALLARRGVTQSREVIAEAGTAIYLSLAQENEHLLCDLSLLQAMAKRYPMMVVTGRYRQEYDAVWAERLNPLFAQVYCRDDFAEARPKPAPDLIEIALKAHGLKRGYYVGNSVDDMKAARAAGLIAVGLTRTQPAEKMLAAGADYLVNDVQELEKGFCP